MSYKLHWISGSPNSWRIQLVLAYKGLDFESIRIDPSTWDREQSGFYKLNPRGKIPVLEDGNDVIYESLAIMAYLEAKHPEPGLLGKDVSEMGLAWQTLAELVHYVSEQCSELARSIFQETLLDDIELSNKRASNIYDELLTLEDRLKDRDFLALDKLSMADFYFYPTLAFLLRITKHESMKSIEAPFLPFDKQFPNLGEWMKRVEAVKGFEDAYPPHWKE